MKFLLGILLISITIWCNVSFAEISPGPEPKETGNLGFVQLGSDQVNFLI